MLCRSFTYHVHSFIHSLVFSLRGRAGRNQSQVMWPVWLWHTTSWASSWGYFAIAFPRWLLYPYRIITLGSNKHKGDDAPWNWIWRQRVTYCEGLTTYTLHNRDAFVKNGTATATHCEEGLWKYSALRQQQLLVTLQGVLFIHYASPWPRMIYSQLPVWVLNV